MINRNARRNRWPLLGGVAIAAVLGLAAPVLAQEAPAAEEASDVGEVTITARKREERLRDVPIAASVVDAQVVEQKGGTGETSGIVSATPGARFNDLAFSTLSEVSLRSSGTARGTNAETGVGLYANGVYVGGGLQFARNYTRADFFDLGRAEVLRGTLGALYGRNAVGGAVNLISQQPTYDGFNGKIFVDYGPEIDKKAVQIIANLQADDAFALRFGVEMVDQDGGNYYNSTRDVYSDAQRGFIARGQARFRHGPLDATLMLQRQDMDIGGGGFSLNIKAGTGCPATAAAVCYLQDYIQPRYVAPHNTAVDVEQRVDQAVLTVNWDFDWGLLTSTTSQRRRETVFISDNDLMDAPTLANLRATGVVIGGANQRTDASQNLSDTTDTTYQDLHLTGEVGRLNWLVGIEYLYIDSYYVPIQISNGVTRAGSRTVSTLEYTSIAPYGAVGFDITDSLNLSAELRYTDDDKSFSTISYALPAGTVASALRMAEFANTNWSYNLVATWKFAENWMAYGKVGTGYRAGGFNSGANPPPPAVPPRPVEPTFDNEESITYEAGAKGNIFPSLYVTLAAYHTITDGALTQVDTGCFLGNPVCNARPTNFAINAGKALLDGVEAEAIWRFDLGPASGSLRSALSRQWGEFEGGPYDGFEVPQKPDWLASANLNLQAPIGPVTGLFNLNYRAQRGGVESVAVGATAPADLKKYQILDLRTGIRWGQTEVAVYVNNLTDEQYTLLEAATSVRWSPPRTWGMQLRYRW
jgi:iron complex outermembrane receptor protein